MAFDNIDSLLSVLRRVQLLSPEQVDEIAQLQIDWLTTYQLQLLLAGQWRELTLGPYQVLDCLGEGPSARCSRHGTPSTSGLSR